MNPTRGMTRALSGALALGALLMSCSSTEEDELFAHDLGVEAFVYGYPLVLMDVTSQVVTSVPEPGPTGRAPFNQFSHVAAFPDASFRDVVRPNTDTLYSIAWVDLTGGPIVLTLPDTGERYHVVPLLDAWTNVFRSLGTRTTGNRGGKYALTPPGWKGELSFDVERISAPTNLVWIIARFQTNGVDDYANVHEFQRGLGLAPLSEGQPVSAASAPATKPPVMLVDEMDAAAFFGRLAEALKSNPPAEADAPLVERLASVGLVPGQDFVFDSLDSGIRQGLIDCVTSAKASILAAYLGYPTRNGWSMPRGLGDYEARYMDRAVIARIGLGANLSDDAIYCSAAVDVNGRALNGERRYVLRFPADQAPPVNGFWSLTVYDEEGFLVPNQIDRFAIGDRDDLVFNVDGSLDIHLSRPRPEGNESNWLPVPSGPYSLTLRCYWPKAALLDGAWKVPPIERAN